jgi:hypothetical protein
MITCFLQGGLGNQMFQISNVISESRKYLIECKFKSEAYTPMQAFQPSKYANNIFRNIDLSLTEEEYNNAFILTGYFQSVNYFKEIENEIKEIFSPSSDFLNKIYQLYPELSYDNTLSIHIRRGDYLTIPDILPIVDISYINKAIDIIGKYSKVFIFSDDKAWAKENLNNENFIVVENLDDYEELWMMSLCKNNIISNSTFSWWGSFLNKNLDKKIIAPSLWTGPNGPSMDEIYLDNFIIVPVFYDGGFLKV